MSSRFDRIRQRVFVGKKKRKLFRAKNNFHQLRPIINKQTTQKPGTVSLVAVVYRCCSLPFCLSLPLLSSTAALVYVALALWFYGILARLLNDRNQQATLRWATRFRQPFHGRKTSTESSTESSGIRSVTRSLPCSSTFLFTCPLS